MLNDIVLTSGYAGDLGNVLGRMGAAKKAARMKGRSEVL